MQQITIINLCGPESYVFETPWVTEVLYDTPSGQEELKGCCVGVLNISNTMTRAGWGQPA